MKKRYVAFVDILGFGDLIKRIESEESLYETIRDALTDLREKSQDFRQYSDQRVKKGHKTSIELTAFSDSYLLSDGRSAWRVLAAVQYLASQFLCDGILTRGGVVHGYVFHKDGVAFGQGVVDAYKLEKHVAHYPRIVVDPEIKEEAWEYHRDTWKGKLLRQDVDGCWYVNLMVPFLSSWKPLAHQALTVDPRVHLDCLASGITKAEARARRHIDKQAKVNWLKKKYNDAAMTHKLPEL